MLKVHTAPTQAADAHACIAVCAAVALQCSLNFHKHAQPHTTYSCLRSCALCTFPAVWPMVAIVCLPAAVCCAVAAAVTIVYAVLAVVLAPGCGIAQNFVCFTCNLELVRQRLQRNIGVDSRCV